MTAAQRTAALGGLVGLWAIGWLALAGPSLGQVEPSAQPDAATVDTYISQCEPCHGARGEGGVGPALFSNPLTLEARELLIANGRRAMPGFSAVLTSEEIRDVALFMDHLVVAEVYATQCAPCHGANGEGGIGPSLLTKAASAEDQMGVITNGLGAMPAFGPTLDTEQLQAVIDFVAGFAATDAATEELYQTQCAPCHGAAGEGGVGGSLQLSTLGTAELIAVITHGVGTMPTFGGTLSPEEIESVAEYVGTLSTVSDEEASEPPGEDNARGAELFGSQCALCHGSDGAGGSGPGLIGTAASTSALVSVIRDGSGSMPAFGGSLSESDIEAIADWLASRGSASGDASRLELLGVGAEIYTANCSTCHGADASGGTGPDLTATTLSIDELASVVRSGRDSMPGFEASLSADDIEAVTVFIEAAAAAATPAEFETVVPTSGQSVFISNCATCHGADAGGGLAPTLTGGHLTANEIISRVYGGHRPDMPAFEGVLSADQIQAAAGYIIDLPRTGSGGISLTTIAILLAAAAIVILGGFWAAGRIGRPPAAGGMSERPAPRWQAPLEP